MSYLLWKQREFSGFLKLAVSRFKFYRLLLTQLTQSSSPLVRVLKGGGGGYQSHFPAHFFPNPTSQCSNPIPIKRIQKNSQCYTHQLFSLRNHNNITAFKYDSCNKDPKIYENLRRSSEDRIILNCTKTCK